MSLRWVHGTPCTLLALSRRCDTPFPVECGFLFSRSGLTIYCAATSGLRDQKAPKDRQQPCFLPKDRSYPSKYLMAVTVRLWRSAEDVGRFMPLFTMLYRCYLPKRFRLLRAAFCNFFSLLSTEGPYMCYATAQMCRKGIAGRM